MIPTREIAPAKLNLALHVRGELPDGRHAIETVFAFCTDGDRLSAEPAGEISLAVSGQFAGDLPAAGDNLVMRAAEALRAAAAIDAGAAIWLEKRLPVASGIGGGSADAGAALRLLTSLWKTRPSACRDRRVRAGQRRSGLPAAPCRREERAQAIGSHRWI